MHIQGLLGGPRRSNFSEYAGGEQVATWISYQIAQAVGGTILFIGIVLMVYIFIQLDILCTTRGSRISDCRRRRQMQSLHQKFLKTGICGLGLRLHLILFAYTIPVIDIYKTLTTWFPAIRLANWEVI